jgi:hypothetical protein
MEKSITEGKIEFVNSEELQTLAKVKRSRIRREVLRYLVLEYPEMTNASSIAFELRSHLIDVCGVLHGALPRYREEDSLVALGLIEEITKVGGYSHNRKFYRSTEKARSFYKKYSSILERVKK